ncbi:exosome non-catalytic core subunit rrp46 [Cystobasidiomycetes sp. EMM_F5]
MAAQRLEQEEGPISVQAAVNGPLEVRLRDEIVDRATFEINVRPVRGLPGPATKSLASTLSHIFEPLLLLNRHPRSLLQLSVQTLALPSTKFSKPFKTFDQFENDLGEGTAGHYDAKDFEAESVCEKAAAVNAASCALMDSAIGMKGVVCAVGVAILPARNTSRQDDEDDETDTGMEGVNDTTAHIVLDPSPEEERDARCTMCIAFSFGERQGGQEGDVCLLDMSSGTCQEAEASLHNTVDIGDTTANV